LTIVFLGSLDVTIWADAGISFQFSTIETTIRVNFESCFSLGHLSDLDDDLEHVVSAGLNAGMVELNAATKNFAINFHLFHQN
jgi:hypothetical protein